MMCIVTCFAYLLSCCELFWSLAASYGPVCSVVAFYICWSPSPPYIHTHKHTYTLWGWHTDVSNLLKLTTFALIPPVDPQAYSVKPDTDVPTIHVDLASPQSPDSVNLMDEFRRAGQQQPQQKDDQDRGLMMKPPSGPSGPKKPGEEDTDRDQQKLMRCLSDPGPSADEDEDEPFLPWVTEDGGLRELIAVVQKPNKPKLLMLYKPERKGRAEEKKRAISLLLSLLFIFSDRNETAAAAIHDGLRHSGENYALPKVWTVLVSDNVIFTSVFRSGFLFKWFQRFYFSFSKAFLLSLTLLEMLDLVSSIKLTNQFSFHFWNVGFEFPRPLSSFILSLETAGCSNF